MKETVLQATFLKLYDSQTHSVAENNGGDQCNESDAI
jgi:hypothetical protein